jgi:hypothetical protein
MKVGRYLIAAVIAEVIALIVWFSSDRFTTNDALVFLSVGRIVSSESIWNMEPDRLSEFQRLHVKARQLAFQLNFLDTSAPLVVGFPAIAVLAIWIYDRWRSAACNPRRDR